MDEPSASTLLRAGLMFNHRRRFRSLGLALALLWGGCGSSDRLAAPVDAVVDAAVESDAASDATEIDATEIDAAPAHTLTKYVLDHEALPADQMQADAAAFDLDGDAIVDNRVATVLAAYTGMGFDNQPTIDAWFARGEAITLAQLGAEDYLNDPDATFTLFQGANPMPPACAGSGFTNCGKHLLGTGSFSLLAGAPVDPPLEGAIANGKLAAGPGHLTVQFSIGFSPPIMVTLIGARVELIATATTLTGKVGGAIPQPEIVAKVMPALRESFAVAVYRDCDPFGDPPACACAPGSLGEKVIAQLDHSPADCGISLAEVQADAMTAALVVPDVIVEGQPGLSIGFGVSAVPGVFSAP